MTSIVTLTPEVFAEGCAAISARDPIMRALILRYGNLVFPTPTGVFEAFVRAVVAQQISNVAADRIYTRLRETFLPLSDAWRVFSEESLPQLREIGLSQQKASAILTMTRFYQSGQWSDEKFQMMDDEAVIASLCEIKGVGIWTAKSVLIFGLARADVFPIEDYGIREALVRLYMPQETAKTLTRQTVKSRVKLIECLWESYRTIATWFLWCSLENSASKRE